MAEINHYLSEEDAFQLDTVAVRLVKTREPLTSEEPLTSADAVVRALAKEMSDYDREVVGVINFDSKMRPINVNFVSAGTLNSSIAHPRELMKSAILSNAASMMMIHNHPSQDVTPSKADVEITDKMMKICDVMNIPLLDHIIIGGYGEEYFSFADKKVMPVINTRYKDDYMKLDFPSVAENNNRSDEYVMEHNTAYKTSDGKDKSDKIKEITEKLEQGVKEVFESEKYKSYLNTLSKFHNYSLNNTLLIAAQNPNATLVAGFKSWEKNFDRHVKKGEKGIKILAPSPYTKKILVEKIDPISKEIMLDGNGNPVKEETEVKMTAFRIVSVFDVEQTAGKPLPELGIVELNDNVKEYNVFFTALKESSSLPVEFENIQGLAKGYFSNAEQKIVIKEGMSESQTVKTAVHELAHAILHNKENNEEGAQKDRHTKEVEAESVAYTVCQHFGIDTSDYSFSYIAGWSSGKEINELKQSLETIQKTASELISSIESKIPEIRKNMQMNANVTESVTFVSEELSENESYELLMSGGVSEDEPDEQYGMVM